MMKPSAASLVAGLADELAERDTDAQTPAYRRSLRVALVHVRALSRELEYQRLRERDKKRRAVDRQRQLALPTELPGKADDQTDDEHICVSAAIQAVLAGTDRADLVSELLAAAALREVEVPELSTVWIAQEAQSEGVPWQGRDAGDVLLDLAVSGKKDAR